ncbi:MAG TPA: threonine synthase [Dehalococcoidia bacterium]|nr:threonine synthase [Dehalococcoidia bacterium]
MSFVTGLECSRCSAHQPADRVASLCQDCCSPLLVRYDLPAIKRSVDRDLIAGRPPTMWRYQELLAVDDPSEIVSLGEGFTPNLRLLGAGEGFRELWLKDEGLNPTGTFKARGAAAGVTRARALGVGEFAMPTAGNAGGAWAAYGARAGLKAHIVMPSDAPAINKKEAWACGADVRLVRGLISDAGAIVARACQKYGWFDASTLKEPYRIEGKKTMGVELAEQFDWRPPEVIIYPAGGGVGLIGIWKAFDELRELGWMEQNVRPRLVAVQAQGCMPIVKAFEEGKSDSEFWPDASTIAAGIRVPKAIGDFIVLRGIRETNGVAVAVSDDEIRQAITDLAATEGMLVCPEGAATYAAARKLRASGDINADERVLLLNTGTGLKYPEVLAPDLEVLDPDAEI